MGGEQEKKEGESWSPWSNLPGLPHGITEFMEGSNATREAIDVAKEVMAPNASGFAPALVAPETAGAAASSGGLFSGLRGLASPTMGQTVEAARAAAPETSGVSMASKALAPLALGAGLWDMWGAGKSMSEHGANLENTPDMVKGGLEATAGGVGTMGLLGSALSALGFAGAGGAVGGAAAAAAPVGMVAGAGAAGMAVGDLMAHAADSDKTKTGFWGKDEGGKNRSAMDWGANWGTWVDSHIGDKNAAHPSVLGGIAAGAGGIVGGFGGAAHWLGKTVGGLF